MATTPENEQSSSLDKRVLDADEVPNSNNKYKTPSFMYPADLLDMDLKDGNVNHVRFYINVQSDANAYVDPIFEMGGFLDGYEDSTESLVTQSRAKMNTLVGKPIDSNEFKNVYSGVKAIEGAVTGAVAGGVLQGNFKGAFGGALAGGVLGGGKALITTTALDDYAGISFGKPSKRLAGFIALYMPNDLSTRYSMDWSTDEMDIAVSAASNPELTNQIKSVLSSANKGNYSQAAEQAGSAAVKTIGANILLKNNPSLSAVSRAAANPRKEQVFKGVNYRSFSFNYTFAPKDEKEAATVLSIIRQFKYHMHPEFKTDSANFIYVYPSEFDIEYCFGEGVNQKINRISSCVLTDMTVNYSPNGVFSTFPDGTPTQIAVGLSFTELELLTKDRILDGGM